MAQNWNLQDIRPAQPRKKRRREMYERQSNASDSTDRIVEAQDDTGDDGTLRINVHDGNKKNSRKLFLSLFALIVIVGGFFAISYMLKGAQVIVYPRFQQPTIDALFTAHKESVDGELTYEIMTLEASGERQVQASGQEEVTSQATGEIEIVKTTPGTQRLIKNTRFETPDGLIYKIDESVVVPGAVSDANGELSPGRIRASVFSDGFGEQYNIDPTRFTVPGLESDPALFESIYAESNQKFTGGFEGQKFIIDENELETARQALRTELRDALLNRVSAEKPAGFVVFEGAITFTYESLPSVKYGEDLATIKEIAFLRIPIFSEEDFSSFIAQATVPGYEGMPVRIDNYNELDFMYASSNPQVASTDISQYQTLDFEISGKPFIVWTFDEESLRENLAGGSKTVLNNVLGAYPAIERAEANINPFWAQSFPSELEEITITEVIERP